MTPLELLCLSNMFEYDEHEGTHYFYSRNNVEDVICVDYQEFSAALAEPSNAVYGELEEFTAPLTAFPIGSDGSRLMVDLSMLSWEFFIREIVKRSKSLNYVSAMISYNCTKMRTDGFGGMVVLITAEGITAKDTNEALKRCSKKPGSPQSSASSFSSNPWPPRLPARKKVRPEQTRRSRCVRSA